MPQFDVSSFPSQAFWLVIVFGVLYFFISRVIAPTAESILTSRHRINADNISAAEEYNAKSAELEKLKTEKLAEANKAAEELRASALKSVADNFEHKRGEVNDELKLKTNRALNEIQLFTENFHAQETEPCVNLAAFIIERITGKPADIKLLKKIEDKYNQ